MLACYERNAQIVKKLLEKGADINFKSRITDDTAFTLACLFHREEIIMVLLDFNVDVSIRCKGKTGYDLLDEIDPFN